MKGTGEDVGLVVDEVGEVEAVELAPELEVEVELEVTSMNIPPAMAGGDTELVFLAAVL